MTRTVSKKDKKGKKSLISEFNDEPVPSVEPNATTDIAGVAADDDWLSGGGVPDKKKDKKGKRNSIASSTKEDTPAPALPPVPHIPDVSSDIWGSSKKEKKGKKGKVSESVPDVATAPDLLEVKDILAEDDWGASGWGITSKEKKKKEKEKDKEKREEEEREKAEEEEQQRKQDEEEEERTREEDLKKKAEDDWAASLVGLTPRERKKRERDREKEREKEKKEKEKKEKEEKELREKEEKEAAEKAEREQQEQEEKEKQEEEERKAKEKEDNWAVGLSPKEKRKKEKERERERKEKEKQEKEEKERQEREENERQEQEEKDRQEQEEKERLEEEEKAKAKEKSKGKLGKKSKSSALPEVSKTKDLLEDSVPDTAPAATEDTWGSWGGSKKAKRQGGKEMIFEAPPPAPTPPAQGLTEPEEEGDEDHPEDDWGVFAHATTKGKKNAKKEAQDKAEEPVDDNKSAKDELKKKDPSKEETPAKAAKSFWSGMAATSTAKAKANSKDAAKAKKEPEAEREISNLDEIVEETTKKTGKDKTDSKLTKTSTKDSDKSKSSDAKKKAVADDIMDATHAKSKDGKAKKGVDSTKEMDKNQNDDTFDITNIDEAFTSSWGSSSKKTSGNKANEGKTEIGQQGVANQKSAGSKGKGAWNEPETTGEETDDQPSISQPTKSSKTTMSTTKSTVKSSVLQRAKEFEALEKAKNSKQESAPPAAKFDQKGALAKSKIKDPEPELVSKKKASKDSVPGSFPGDVMDDLDLLDSPPAEEEKPKKSAKSTKESKTNPKAPVTPESARPPTPPPEPKEEKPVKKERARVSRAAGGPTSWGLWGAPPAKEVKKETKAKDDAGVAPTPKKEKVTGLTRSKPTKTVKEKEKEVVKSDTKSTDSDKPEKVERPKKAESRPPKTRNSSGFGGLFGGPPPRAKAVRRSSQTSGPKVTSRRASVDVDAPGLPSPPAEDAPEVSGKAAKLMGVGTGRSDKKALSKGKQKGEYLLQVLEERQDSANSDHLAVPDPYAIDSDDMVMVNGLDDPIINAPIPKKSSQPKAKAFEPEPVSLKKDLPDRTRTKKDSKVETGKSKRQSRACNDFEDDVVMVDAGPSSGADVAEGPDDMQFITKPKGLTRSSTSAKKSESRKSGLFGGFLKTRTPETVERSRSKAIVEEVAPRKRTVTGGDDSAKRPRRDEHSRDGRKRSEKTDRAAQGYVYDTAGEPTGATEAEEADARKEERRAKRAEKDSAAREEALKYEADRRTKRREAEKNKVKDDKDQLKKSKKEDDAEARRQEEKEARRVAREARRAKEEEQANRDFGEEILKPRSKRRDTDKELPAESSSRPRKSDRRRSYIDKQTLEEDEIRRTRREERPKSIRRKSTAPVEDYFDPRNGTRGAPDTDPYGGNEHTASWVKSQASDPPEPPPVEPTIVEPAPDLRATSGADDLNAEEDFRKSSHRKSKRSSRMYTDPIAEDQDSRRRRRTEKEGIRSMSSEGSAEGDRYARRQSDALGGVKLGAGVKTFDGKTGQGKRASWFQKLGGKI